MNPKFAAIGQKLLAGTPRRVRRLPDDGQIQAWRRWMVLGQTMLSVAFPGLGNAKRALEGTEAAWLAPMAKAADAPLRLGHWADLAVPLARNAAADMPRQSWAAVAARNPQTWVALAERRSQTEAAAMWARVTVGTKIMLASLNRAGVVPATSLSARMPRLEAGKWQADAQVRRYAGIAAVASMTRVSMTRVSMTGASMAGAAAVGHATRSVAPVAQPQNQPNAAREAMRRSGSDMPQDSGVVPRAYGLADQTLATRLARLASLPSAGGSGFDTRLGPDWNAVGSFG